MADYIYLLDNRLSADQRNALRQLREAAHEAGMLIFLTGDAVRDLTSGHAVRELEVAVHGNALKLKKIIENSGGKIWGEDEVSKTLYVCFSGTVRVDVVSTHSVEYPKPGNPVYHPASIQDDLRRRDFTVNAMAISLNEGSFGLLMDPMNGAADLEARTLRLVSNYGFLEEPALLIRATRYITRLGGWELDPKTRTRYENAVGENVIEHLSETARSQELEQIGHEEEGLKVLQALEAEGWMKVLFPAWTAAKADTEKLSALHDLVVELLVQGVRADVSAAQMQLLTAKLAAKDLAALKKIMLRPGFVEEWNGLDAMAAKFAKVLLAKENATASAGYKLLTTYDPEAVLWLAFTTRDAAVKERFHQFLKVWPEARQHIPHALMQEMRITPELQGYNDIVQAVFLDLIDGRLSTPEELRAFLEPHSPPAPPPQVTIKRPRAKRGAEAKVKERSIDEDEDEDDLDEDEEADDMGGDDDDELDLGLALPKVDLDVDLVEDADAEPAEEDVDEDEADSDEDEAPVKRGARAPKDAPVKQSKAEKSAAKKPEKAADTATVAPATLPSKPATAAPAHKPAEAPVAKKVAPAPPAPTKAATAAKPAPPPAKSLSAAKPVAKPAASAAHGKAAAAKPAHKSVVKPQPKPAHKPVAKPSPAKSAPAKGKPAPAHSKAAKPSKPDAKKTVAKPGKKR